MSGRTLSIIVFSALVIMSGAEVTQSASIPTQLTIQGRLLTSGGNPPPAGNKTFTFRIFDVSVGGTQVWPTPAPMGEDQTVFTDQSGLWTAQVGAVVALSASVFDGAERWLDITVDDGMNPPETLTRIAIKASPYAYRVATIDGADAGEITDTMGVRDPGGNVAVLGAGGLKFEASGGPVSGPSGLTFVIDGHVRSGQDADSIWMDDSLADRAKLALDGLLLTGGNSTIRLGPPGTVFKNAFTIAESGTELMKAGVDDHGPSMSMTSLDGNTTIQLGPPNTVFKNAFTIAESGTEVMKAGVDSHGPALNMTSLDGNTTISLGPPNTVFKNAFTIAESGTEVMKAGVDSHGAALSMTSFDGNTTISLGPPNTVFKNAFTIAEGGAEVMKAGVGAFGPEFSMHDVPMPGAKLSTTHSFQVGTTGLQFVQNTGTVIDTPVALADQGITLKSGAVAGHVLTSDSKGLGTWQPAGGGGGAYWRLDGNSGTTPGTHFLGTTDNQALEFKVNSQRAIRIEPDATSPNIIGGYSGNNAMAGVKGASITGGGRAGNVNSVTDPFGTVGGGIGNRAGDGGLVGDTSFATVGGGSYNTASGLAATVSGGASNTASSNNAAIGGGYYNTASGGNAAVGGGSDNRASGASTAIGGGYSNVASGLIATVGGGAYSKARGDYSVVAGGGGANAADSNFASGIQSTVSGGIGNGATGQWATVGGGVRCRATSDVTTISGGWENVATMNDATVGGGAYNSATGWGSTIAGGDENRASGVQSSVMGGARDTASGDQASVCGGAYNVASGIYSTTVGGFSNRAAGRFSLAAGRRAKANHIGSFVWADSAGDFDFASAATNQFSARCVGGARFVSAINPATGAATAGVTMAAGGGSWSSISDRDAKDNVAPVNGDELLARLAAIPVTTWNYKSQDSAIRHIGPMAQDFYSAFGVGEDDKHITTIDADGVALAAIQALNEKSRQLGEKTAEIDDLKERIAGLEALVEQLMARER